MAQPRFMNPTFEPRWNIPECRGARLPQNLQTQTKFLLKYACFYYKATQNFSVKTIDIINEFIDQVTNLLSLGNALCLIHNYILWQDWILIGTLYFLLVEKNLSRIWKFVHSKKFFIQKGTSPTERNEKAVLLVEVLLGTDQD